MQTHEEETVVRQLTPEELKAFKKAMGERMALEIYRRKRELCDPANRPSLEEVLIPKEKIG